MIDKKKAKEEFRNFVPPKGVFVIRNKETGRVFLGSSLNLKSKFDRIKLTLNTGSFFNSEMQHDWNLRKEQGFEYEVLEELELKDDPGYNYSDDLELLEMIWIEKFQPFEEKCYNKNKKIRMV